MARTQIPNPLTRRHLIEKDMSAQEALEVAEAYLSDDRAAEAIVFLEKADARARLAELAEACMADGDAFLFRQVSHALGEEPAPERWVALAEAAERSGKTLYAATARRWATRDDD